MTTEIGRVKCWVRTKSVGQKDVLDKQTGMGLNVTTTTTAQATIEQFFHAFDLDPAVAFLRQISRVLNKSKIIHGMTDCP